VCVHDAIRERVVDRLLEDGPEAGHRDHVDVVARERVDDVVGVGDAIEVLPEALAFDDLDSDVGCSRDLRGATRAVHEHDHDR
jgi:hypothetical protein